MGADGARRGVGQARRIEVTTPRVTRGASIKYWGIASGVWWYLVMREDCLGDAGKEIETL